MGETEVVCEAVNGAVLEGLLTVFHQERSADGLANLQVGGVGCCPFNKVEIHYASCAVLCCGGLIAVSFYKGSSAGGW